MTSSPWRKSCGPRARLGLLLALAASAGPTSAAALCDGHPVLTPLAENTSAGSALFALVAGTDADSGSTQGAGAEQRDWLLVLDAPERRALLFPDPLADLRTGASHGPGPFLTASRCGDDCFQPVQWSPRGWRPLGHPIEFDPSSSLHFTYEPSGVPWLVFHQLTDTKGVLKATAFRWDGGRWERRGQLLVQGVGSPAATADPRGSSSILSGTGRFDAEADPAYWLPALPVPSNSPGGHVVALGGTAAAFLTFDSRVLSTTDGSTWRQERWTPWASSATSDPVVPTDPGSAGIDYSLDRPAGSDPTTLRLLWYDDRQRSKPALHLTSWSPPRGWQRDATLALPAMPGGAADYIVHTGTGHTRTGGWLLVGPCRSDDSATWLEALAVDDSSIPGVPIRIPLAKGWEE